MWGKDQGCLLCLLHDQERRVGSEITCVKSLTMAKASASRPAGLVTLEEKVRQSELWTLKSPRTIISERGDCRVMVSIDLARWSKRSSLLSELRERYRVQIYFVAWGRKIFSQTSWKPGLERPICLRCKVCTSKRINAQTPPLGEKEENSS